MTFDPTKPVQTRDGRKARIICTDRDMLDGPIVALVKEQTRGHEGEELLYTYYSTGMFNSSKDMAIDLVNIPVRTSTWQRVFENAGLSAQEHKARPAPETPSGSIAIGFLRRDYEDGKFIGVELETIGDE